METRTKLTLSLSAVSLVLGFMIALGYQQTESLSGLGAIDSDSGAVNKQLTVKLSNLKAANTNAEQQLANVTNELNQYEQQSTGSSDALKQLQTRLQDERILAGVTPVYGPGITVTLMDGSASGSDVEQILTHDWNVKSVVNELFTSGAEAISINDYRVVATSAVECQGPVVTINNHRLGAPFQIDAIGEPSVLKSAIGMPGGILDALRQQGLRVSAPQVENRIQIPAYTDVLQAYPLITSSGN